MLNFDGYSAKFALFEYPFQARLKIHDQIIKDYRFNYFDSLIDGDKMQTLKSISSPTQ